MICDPYRSPNRIRMQKIAQVGTVGILADKTARSEQRQGQLLVEVAIVKITLPIHADEIAAHHTGQISVGEVLSQQPHVSLELPLGDQHRAKALYWHIGQSQQIVK